VAALSRSYAVANRPMLSPPTLKAVSFIPSGSQIRSRRASPKDMPVPGQCLPVARWDREHGHVRQLRE
jgi:hypothetical protein